MLGLAEKQGDFAAALRAVESSAPAGLSGANEKAIQKRFSVYRNNVIVGLTETLEAAFPAVTRVVGQKFSRALARAYVLSNPPTSPILLEYGSTFPDFIENFEPAATLPYLPDVARIERAWTEAYHASEATALDATALASVPPYRAPALRFAVHPSMRIIRSQFPVLTIWRMNVADGVPGPVNFGGAGEDVLVSRAETEVEVRCMPEGGAAFLAALAKQCTLAEALQAGISHAACFNLHENLTALIAAGIFVGFGFDEVDDHLHFHGATC